MLSNQILQSVVIGLKKIINYDIDILSTNCKVIASTKSKNIGSKMEQLSDFIFSEAESQSVKGYHFFKVYDLSVECIVRVEGEDSEAYKVGQICVFQIQNLISANKEKFDKDNFIKNLLLDNLLDIDIFTRSKKLDIAIDAPRCVFLIEGLKKKDISSFEILRSLYPEKNKDFITSIDEKSIILVKELYTNDITKEINAVATTVIDTYNTELMEDIRISVGGYVTDLKKVSASYKEAKLAIEVGRIFGGKSKIINYNKLGIGRLICQLPLPLCGLYVKEVLKGITIDSLDDEMILTINKLFENNLNVSETSRQLYIHRNTLVYRLDKLQKITGLDLRNFDDSIVFKITLMVNKYMEYRKITPY